MRTIAVGMLSHVARIIFVSELIAKSEVQMKIKLGTILFLFIISSFYASTPAGSNAEPAKRSRDESFSAVAQLPVAGTTTNVRIYIKGYSSAQDAQQLHATLLDGGPNAVLKALEKMKSLGRIEREGTVGSYDFKFILSQNTPNGRTIYAVADRPIGFLEAYFNTRSRDYPFGILQLNLKSDEGEKEKGEGTLIYAAQVKVIDGQRVEIENYTFAPIRLLGVNQL